MQSLLKRQLRRFFGSDFQVPPEWEGFICAVDGAYSDFEADRRLTERSTELSSQELHAANAELLQSREMFRLMAESTNAIPFTLDLVDGSFTYIGAGGIAAAGLPAAHWAAPGALDIIIPREANPEIRRRFDECQDGPFEFVALFCQNNGVRLEVRWTGTCERTAHTKILRGLMLDVTEMRRLGRELAAAQKLESVGRLAAGVAHEINTPVQFVSDNMGFVRDSIAAISAVLQKYQILKRAVEEQGDALLAAQAVNVAEKDTDLEYVIENLPPAMAGALDGLHRIATIVRSMKEFAHPDQASKTLADLNQAIQSTLVVARNEYKYVAEVATDFGDLPPVECYLGEINQVVLNLIVNAAHAISDVIKDSGSMGTISIRTRLDAEEVEIAIGDTGTGIPLEVREKIFDPFFTTKEVGRGTGQGLSIAHAVVVKKHAGTLRFETECGRGTTFFIRLPVAERQRHQVEVGDGRSERAA